MSEFGFLLGDVVICEVFFWFCLGMEECEYFEVVFFDICYWLIVVEWLFFGIIDGVEVYFWVVI